MSTCQPAILAPVPASARFLTLQLAPGVDVRALVARLAAAMLDPSITVGLGLPLVAAVGAELAGLRAFPAIAGPGVSWPSTQGALWASIDGADPGETLHRARRLLATLGDALTLDEDVLAFRYAEGRDLSGYEDGTENPKDDAAVEAAIVACAGAGLDGSSFVATRRWVHELGRLEALSPAERDALVGRRREDNEEMDGAPASAHVKRSAQESFEPAAFMLRRSMPWGGAREHGLYFVAYGATLDAFERVLRRMAGLDDGVVDGLARFTRAVSGGYYWCPPIAGGKLDLRALGA